MAKSTGSADRRLQCIVLALITAVLVVLASWRVGLAQEVAALPDSDYAIAQAQPFNRVDAFPPYPMPTPEFRPVGDWLGRLMLPTEAEYAAEPGDWAWFEVWHGSAAVADRLGQRIKLTWKPSSDLDTYLAAVTRDVSFTPEPSGLGRAEPLCPNGWMVVVRWGRCNPWPGRVPSMM